MNPFVFLVGCPRSGTTLLQRLVDAHPQVAITPETHWIPSYFHKLTRKTPDATVTPRRVARLFRYRRFPQLGLDRSDLESLLTDGIPVSYARFVSGIFDRYGRARGKPLVGDKTPGYARHLRLLHRLWPEAKFVHLIRDGRDVGLSAIHWTKPGKLLLRCPLWAEDRVTTAALWWQWHVRMAREEGQALGAERYYELRYEALVHQPAEQCIRLCAFLGVSYEETMLCFHEGRTRTEPGLDAKEAWLPVTPGLRDWRAQMPAADLERFEAAAGDLLDELGYPRARACPSRAVRDQAAQLRDRFIQDLRSRAEGLPAHWYSPGQEVGQAFQPDGASASGSKA